MYGYCILQDWGLATIPSSYKIFITIGTFYVAGSFGCLRRTVLDERLKYDEFSTAVLIRTLFHQNFQAGISDFQKTIHLLVSLKVIEKWYYLRTLRVCMLVEV
ncbi:hypothetical protein AAHE18_13G191500 [Arachis hypogaea]